MVHRKSILPLAACLLVSVFPFTPLNASQFARADVDASGEVDLNDAVAILGLLFLDGGRYVPCWDAADVDDDGGLSLADPVRLLSYLFFGAAQPPPPFPGCGSDPTPDYLSCDFSSPCGLPPVREAWVARDSAGDGSWDVPAAIAVDGRGNVCVTGTSGRSPKEVLTVKYRTDGTLEWRARHPSGSATALAVDEAGNAYVAGSAYPDGDPVYLTIKYSPAGEL